MNSKHASKQSNSFTLSCEGYTQRFFKGKHAVVISCLANVLCDFETKQVDTS